VSAERLLSLNRLAELPGDGAASGDMKPYRRFDLKSEPPQLLLGACEHLRLGAQAAVRRRVVRYELRKRQDASAAAVRRPINEKDSGGDSEERRPPPVQVVPPTLASLGAAARWEVQSVSEVGGDHTKQAKNQAAAERLRYLPVTQRREVRLDQRDMTTRGRARPALAGAKFSEGGVLLRRIHHHPRIFSAAPAMGRLRRPPHQTSFENTHATHAHKTYGHECLNQSQQIVT